MRNAYNFELQVYFINMKCTFKSLRNEMTHHHVNAIRNQNIILV